MAKRQREWAKRARAALVEKLGGLCLDCGETHPAKLELDHLTPRSWVQRHVESSWRMAFWRREAAAGELAVRCRRCNAKKGEPQVPEGGFAFDVPF